MCHDPEVDQRFPKTEKDEEPDPNLRVLECMKSNYRPLGETIMLRWKEGLFLPAEAMGSLDKMAVEQKTDQTFLDLLDRFNRQGRNLSEKPNAPTLFSKDPQAKGGGFRKEAFAAAMHRLFAANKIRVESHGPPSRGRSRLISGGKSEPV